jgi:predicted transposase YbfD/YdcC
MNGSRQVPVKMSNMITAKEQVKELLEVLPDDVTFDDLHYHIFVREKIDEGVRDLEEGRILSENEMEATMKKWLEE